MITEFFAMLSQSLSSRKVSFIEVFGQFHNSCLAQALSTLIFLLEGIVCSEIEACGNDFRQNPQLHPPAKSLVQVPWANQV